MFNFTFEQIYYFYEIFFWSLPIVASIVTLDSRFNLNKFETFYSKIHQRKEAKSVTKQSVFYFH